VCRGVCVRVGVGVGVCVMGGRVSACVCVMWQHAALRRLSRGKQEAPGRGRAAAAKAVPPSDRRSSKGI
jgi:hypothetical protein